MESPSLSLTFLSRALLYPAGLFRFYSSWFPFQTFLLLLFQLCSFYLGLLICLSPLVSWTHIEARKRENEGRKYIPCSLAWPLLASFVWKWHANSLSFLPFFLSPIEHTRRLSVLSHIQERNLPFKSNGFIQLRLPPFCFFLISFSFEDWRPEMKGEFLTNRRNIHIL